MNASLSFAEQFSNAICQQVELVEHGLDRYIVHVPFMFDDGDHYVIVAQQSDSGWTLTDEGHTFMHLSYTVPQFDEGNRRSIIDRVLNAHHVEDVQGELRVTFRPERAGDALFSFVHAIAQVMDMSFLSRERVRSTFAEDFRLAIDSVGQGRSVQYNYSHPVHDLTQLYLVDARINGSRDSQVLVFAIPNDDMCQRATITLYRWEGWGEKFAAVGVFRDQTEINRHDLARFSDVAGHQFATIDTARERLPGVLNGLLSH